MIPGVGRNVPGIEKQRMDKTDVFVKRAVWGTSPKETQLGMSGSRSDGAGPRRSRSLGRLLRTFLRHVGNKSGQGPPDMSGEEHGMH